MRHGPARRALVLLSAVVLITALVYYRSIFGAFFMTSTKSSFMFVGNEVRPRAPALEVAPPPRPVPDR